MKKKSILFVVNNFNIGGPQKSLLALLYNLDLNEVEVDIVSLSNSGTLLPYLPKGVKVIRVDSLVSYSLLNPKKFKEETFKILFSKNSIFSLYAISTIFKGLLNKKMVQEKQKYWLKVKNNLPKLDKEYDYAFGVSGGHSIMFITDCVIAKNRVGWIRSDYNVLKRNHDLDREYFNQMDKILSVSQMCKNIFNEIFPENSSKVDVFYNLLPFKMYENIQADSNIIKNEKSAIKVLTICRLDPNKGLDLAISSLEILLEKNLNIKWFVLGDGEYRTELERIIKEKSLENNFILLGFQINTGEFIKQADIIVHPSRFEGKSNVVDEAKYLLKPIVATRYNTVAEQLTHEETGLIAEMNSVSISENIEKLINSPQLKKDISINLKKLRYSDTESLMKFQRIIR